MTDPSLQLLVHGQNISQATLLIDKPGIVVKAVHIPTNPDFLFIDLEIRREAQPGTYQLIFEYQREVMGFYDFELRERAPGSATRQGFGPEDVIYLAMPDRFANGDTLNDNMPDMLEKADRANPNGRHGGDLQGLTQRLDYLNDLGITAIWLNPVLENNMPAYSYHGYAVTDFYKVDPRFGGDKAYLDFIEAAHQKGIKVIMDMVFNHCGSYHWWMNDLPSPDWIHQFPSFTRSNYRAETLMDPYASEFDRTRMLTGWFDVTMPDLNQQNPFLANYLIQNSIWWIEHAGLDGIRMDTYPYSDKDFMVRWMQRIRLEYPHFNVVGETWQQKEAHTAYFQDNSSNQDGYDSELISVTDFPMHYAMIQAFAESEGWTTGLSRLYYILSQDFLYPDPMHTVIFPDNHDLTRYFTSIHEDFDSWKMAMAFLLTTRGIPMIYYGTEFLMTGEESAGHGYIREDFPFFEKSSVFSRQSSVEMEKSEVRSQKTEVEDQQYNNITIEQYNNKTIEPLYSRQIEAHNYLSTLLNWRSENEVLHRGKLKQFIPQDGIYVYFRYDDSNSVMVVMNNNRVEKSFGWERYAEATEGFARAKEVLDGTEVLIGEELTLKPRSVSIFELK
jgi:glycosidase